MIERPETRGQIRKERSISKDTGKRSKATNGYVVTKRQKTSPSRHEIRKNTPKLK